MCKNSTLRAKKGNFKSRKMVIPVNVYRVPFLIHLTKISESTLNCFYKPVFFLENKIIYMLYDLCLLIFRHLNRIFKYVTLKRGKYDSPVVFSVYIELLIFKQNAL